MARFCEKNSGGVNVYKRRVYQLLVPYFVWALFGVLLSPPYSMNKIALIFLKPDSYCWFLWVLFWIFAIFNAVKWMINKFRLPETVTLIVCCLIFMGIMVLFEFRLFGFQFFAYYYIFYTLGYLIHKYDFFKIKSSTCLVVLVIVWAVLAWWWNMHELPSWVPNISYLPKSLLQYAYRGLTAFVAIIAILNIAPKIINGETKFNSLIAEFGKISLGIYVVHITIIGYINDLLSTIIPLNMEVQIIITAVLAMVLSIIIVKLLQKNQWTARIMLGKI